ncbi:thymidine kinase (plasmid) [Clostridium botulinum]|uniref:Thymidine kinase n=1 Tax=Clostridium botulinum TaxID=1491 RepID=A0A9Q1UWE6_CLOBO|nr:thymidine kinase [Clostridium botulinum]KEH96297.1 thymidine kinase [Clostridium botulinum C/D str. Sp77]KOA75733.1 thymidine kinase [Clostridium botulinum]KOA79572.1 thymidine kinase [Clostridium botulinum]KOA81903.1 thymidine kinase [Clostridium botulinum]KOA88303.1 thymidine kinase [Clostridium botulinum]
MAQLYYRYGVLNSAKSANLIMAVHNYDKKNRRVIVLKPKIDTRSKPNIVESRVGISHSCIDFDKNENLFELVNTLNSKDIIHAVFVEEVQFITKEQAKQLHKIVHKLNIPTLGYGLKNTYIDGELFEGSKAMLFYADKIEEIKDVCEYCDKKATQNLRVVNGQPVYSGETIQIGNVNSDLEEYYVPVCGHHYYHPELKK